MYVWVADHFIFQEDTEQQRNSYRNSLFVDNLKDLYWWVVEIGSCLSAVQELSSQGKMRGVIKSQVGYLQIAYSGKAIWK